MEEVKDRFGGLYRQYIVNKSDQQESSIAIYGNDDECFELPDLPLEIREGVDLQVLCNTHYNINIIRLYQHSSYDISIAICVLHISQ